MFVKFSFPYNMPQNKSRKIPHSQNSVKTLEESGRFNFKGMLCMEIVERGRTTTMMPKKIDVFVSCTEEGNLTKLCKLFFF